MNLINRKYTIWIKNIQQFKEMLRNQSRPKPKANPFSPESSNYITMPNPNQLSHLAIKTPEQAEFAPLQKTRTFSHKKLSLTSNMVSQAGQPIKKPVVAAFEVNRFYRPVVKGNVLLQSKKNNVDESKVSLKLSSMSKIDITSPVKVFEPYQEQSYSRIQAQGQENERIKAEIREFMNVRLGSLHNEIVNQSAMINGLRQRIQMLQTEIRNKNQVINGLLAQRFQKSTGNDRSFLESRLSDMQKILPILTAESNKAQNSINSKLDALTRQLVQMNISNESKELGKMKQNIDRLAGKVNCWLIGQESKVKGLEDLCNAFQGKSKVIEEIQGGLRLMGYRVEHLEQDWEGRKEYRLRGMDTNDTINCWDTFQDFVLTNRSHTELKNNSTLSQDDYFFHPESNPQPQSLTLKSSISTSTASASTPTDKFGQLITLMQHLKQKFPTALPIKCSIDKHSRIALKENNRLLMDERTKSYFKVGAEEVGILVNRGYVLLD